MNILFLNSAKEWGGNEKWSLTAATDLALCGHKVYFGCRSDIFAKKHAENVVQFVNIPFANVFDIVSLLKIRSFIKKNAIDIVIPTKQREYLLGGLAAWKKAKIAARLGIDRPLHNFRNRFVFCVLFDAVIVNSKKIIAALALTPGFDTGKCKLVYNGVAIPEINDEVRCTYRQELKVDKDECCIMCIGRLSSQKGIDFALEAFANLCENVKNSRLILVGEGSGRAEYEMLAKKLAITDRVTFTGHRDDISGLLLAADIFWLTSRSEGMSNALLEAMAHAKAVVAFDIAGVDEAIVNNVNGIIIPSEDTVILADASRSLIVDVERRNTIAENARSHVVKTFSREKSVAVLERALMDIIKE